MRERLIVVSRSPESTSGAGRPASAPVRGRRAGARPRRAPPWRPARPRRGSAAGAASPLRGGAALAPTRSMWSSTSSRVMRPPGPVPVIEAGSRPCSLTSRRTTGESSALEVGIGRRRRRGASAARARGRVLAPAPRRRARPRARRAARRRSRLGLGSASAAGSASARALPAGSAACSGLGGGRLGGGSRTVADHRDHGADRDRLALLGADLGDRAGDRRRHLGVDLVGRHLEQRLVLGDGVADLLEPLRDRALGDGLTELGKGHVGHTGSSLNR